MDRSVLAPLRTTVRRGTPVRIMYPYSLYPGGILTGTADGEPDSTGRFYVTLPDGTRRHVWIGEVIVT
jgi:hypothetical protein